MTKTEIVRLYAKEQAGQHLPQIQAVRDLQALPDQLAEILVPITQTADRIDQALSAQRQVIEALTRQSSAQISEHLAALDQERLSWKAALGRLNQQLNDLDEIKKGLTTRLERQNTQIEQQAKQIRKQNKQIDRLLNLLWLIVPAATVIGALGSALLLRGARLL